MRWATSADAGARLVLGVLLLFVFFESPVLRVLDSRYSMLLSEQLLLNRSFELDAYFPPDVYRSDLPGAEGERPLPRNVRRRGGHVYYWYPPGTPVLSVPFAAALRPWGLSTIGADGLYDLAGELKMQRITAAVLMALAGIVFFSTARLCLPVSWSLFVALVGSLGTHVWSIASRSLQAHCWIVLLLALAAHEVLRAEASDRRLRPVWLGILFTLAFWVRPTAPAVIVPLSVYVVFRHRREAWKLLLTGALGLAAFLAFSQVHFRQWLPGYYRGDELDSGHFVYGLTAMLYSPSRSIFVYSSFLLCVAYALVAYRRHLEHRGLAVAALAAVALHVLVVSFQPIVNARGYGPRFLTDLVPLFVLLSILALRSVLDAPAPSRARRRLEIVALVATVTLSVAIHGAGAVSRAGLAWNSRPVPLREDPQRVFDWRRPQWLCALFPQLLPE